MKQYIISLIIFTLCFSGFVSAQENQLEINWLEKIYHKINQKIISPVKQTIENLPQDAAQGIKYLLEKAKEKKQEKQEEIKQEAKKRFNVLNPLKNKIQQGSGLIRKGFYKIKDYLIELFKE